MGKNEPYHDHVLIYSYLEVIEVNLDQILSFLPEKMAYPDFGRSVNLFSTRGDRLCPPSYYWHPRIFRPFDGPVIECLELQGRDGGQAPTSFLIQFLFFFTQLDI